MFGLKQRDPATTLRILMEEMGYNVNELADKAGVSVSTLSALRNRRTVRPTRDTMMRIAAALGVRPNKIWPWA